MSFLILPRRFREKEIDLKNEAGIQIVSTVSGKYLAEVCRNGKVIRQPFGPKLRSNLITNGFFDYLMGTTSTQNINQNAIQQAVCGTGSATPANSDIKLTAATQLTSNVLTGSGNTFSNDTTNGAYTSTIVYEFPAVGSGVTLNEIGLVQSIGSLTTGLSTHALLPSGVLLNAGDNLRLTYSFTYSFPCLITPITVSLAAVNGFNVSGTIKLCGLYANIFGTVGSSGFVFGGSNYYFPSVLFTGSGASSYIGFMSNTAFPAVNTNFSETNLYTGGSSAAGTYTNGSLTRTATLTWTTIQPTSTQSGITMIRLLAHQGPGTGLYLLLTSAQTKANTNTLTITMPITMARA
jgi:hypothetical protein